MQLSMNVLVSYDCLLHNDLRAVKLVKSAHQSFDSQFSIIMRFSKIPNSAKVFSI